MSCFFAIKREQHYIENKCIKPVTQFLPRDAMRKHCLCCRPVSVCLSVTLYYIHTAEDIVKLLFRRGIPIILAFDPIALVPNFKGNPSAGA